MNKKVIRLYTDWSAAEADAVIDLLDTLRDELLNHYSESIIEMRTQDHDLPCSDQTEIDFDEIEE